MIRSTINTSTARLASMYWTDCLWRVETNENSLFLTFDDGPDPETTPQLLKVLKEFGAKASFFLLGEKAEKYPHLAKQIFNDGHAVGNHLFKHEDPWKMAETDQILSLIRTKVLLEKILGTHPLIVRPPFGHLTQEIRRWTKESGGLVCMWDLDPCDYDSKASENMVLRKIAKSRRKGSVVLLHDRSSLLLDQSKLIRKLIDSDGDTKFLAINPQIV